MRERERGSKREWGGERRGSTRVCEREGERETGVNVCVCEREQERVGRERVRERG